MGNILQSTIGSFGQAPFIDPASEVKNGFHWGFGDWSAITIKATEKRSCTQKPDTIVYSNFMIVFGFRLLPVAFETSFLDFALFLLLFFRPSVAASSSLAVCCMCMVCYNHYFLLFLKILFLPLQSNMDGNKCQPYHSGLCGDTAFLISSWALEAEWYRLHCSWQLSKSAFVHGSSLDWWTWIQHDPWSSSSPDHTAVRLPKIYRARHLSSSHVTSSLRMVCITTHTRIFLIIIL